MIHNGLICSIHIFLTIFCQKDNLFAVFRRKRQVGYNIDELIGAVYARLHGAENRKNNIQ